MSKCGIVIGRFQPFHFGHQHIINEIMLDGRVPIILVGTSEGQDERSPLSFAEVRHLIRTVYPDIIVQELRDNDDWDMWKLVIEAIVEGEGYKIHNSSLYYHNKEVDRYKEFECEGKVFTNTFYTDIFIDSDFHMKPLEFVERGDIHINANATDIRRNLDEFKHLLDARVYWKLKDWDW